MHTGQSTLGLSVVLPIYNEAESLPTVIPEISAVLRTVGQTYEILAVDDGSTDQSVATLRELQAAEPALRIIEFGIWG